MHTWFIHGLFENDRLIPALTMKVHDQVRLSWSGLEHLLIEDSERLFGLGLEPVLTTSELAEYLGVQVQAIYDLRTDGRGPSGI